MAQAAFSADVRQRLNLLCFAKKSSQFGWGVKQDTLELFLLFTDFRLRNFDKAGKISVSGVLRLTET